MASDSDSDSSSASSSSSDRRRSKKSSHQKKSSKKDKKSSKYHKDKKEKKEKKDKKDKKESSRDKDKDDRGGLGFDPSAAYAFEDPEELRKAQAKAAKKASKQAEKVAKLLGYTNDANPFGDSNLLKPFVWGKKREREEADGIEETPQQTAAKRMHTMSEIETVRARRVQREEEQKEMQRLRIEEQRLREVAQYGDWAAQEEEFHLNQAKLGSQVRIAAGRAAPIDILAKNVLLIEAAAQAMAAKAEADARQARTGQVLAPQDGGAAAAMLAGGRAELRDPVAVVQALPASDLPAVIEGCRSYRAMEIKRIAAAKTAASSSSTSSSSSRSSSIGARATEGSEEHEMDNLEVFWQALEQIAKACLLSYERAGGASSSTAAAAATDADGTAAPAAAAATAGLHAGVATDVRALLQGKDVSALRKLQQEIDESVVSGARRDISYWEAMSQEIGVHICVLQVQSVHTKLLSKQRLVAQAAAVVHAQGKFKASVSAGDADGTTDGAIGGGGLVGAVADEAGQEGDRIEGLLDAEVLADKLLNTPHYSWSDRFRPRKPRYINKVRTGWDWNKYNSTHYDHDNPPPRIVQGYQFTIFYPDMLDKTAMPTYQLEAASSKEFAILRFHAPGGPYEDVAFQVLNKEWDVNRKAGFRVTFEKGVLSLSFNFKRNFYRR